MNSIMFQTDVFQHQHKVLHQYHMKLQRLMELTPLTAPMHNLLMVKIPMLHEQVRKETKLPQMKLKILIQWIIWIENIDDENQGPSSWLKFHSPCWSVHMPVIAGKLYLYQVFEIDKHLSMNNMIEFKNQFDEKRVEIIDFDTVLR